MHSNNINGYLQQHSYNSNYIQSPNIHISTSGANNNSRINSNSNVNVNANANVIQMQGATFQNQQVHQISNLPSHDEYSQGYGRQVQHQFQLQFPSQAQAQAQILAQAQAQALAQAQAQAQILAQAQAQAQAQAYNNDDRSYISGNNIGERCPEVSIRDDASVSDTSSLWIDHINENAQYPRQQNVPIYPHYSNRPANIKTYSYLSNIIPGQLQNNFHPTAKGIIHTPVNQGHPERHHGQECITRNSQFSQHNYTNSQHHVHIPDESIHPSPIHVSMERPRQVNIQNQSQSQSQHRIPNSNNPEYLSYQVQQVQQNRCLPEKIPSLSPSPFPPVNYVVNQTQPSIHQQYHSNHYVTSPVNTPRLSSRAVIPIKPYQLIHYEASSKFLDGGHFPMHAGDLHATIWNDLEQDHFGGTLKNKIHSLLITHEDTEYDIEYIMDGNGNVEQRIEFKKPKIQKPKAKKKKRFGASDECDDDDEEEEVEDFQIVKNTKCRVRVIVYLSKPCTDPIELPWKREYHNGQITLQATKLNIEDVNALSKSIGKKNISLWQKSASGEIVRNEHRLGIYQKVITADGKQKFIDEALRSNSRHILGNLPNYEKGKEIADNHYKDPKEHAGYMFPPVPLERFERYGKELEEEFMENNPTDDRIKQIKRKYHNYTQYNEMGKWFRSDCVPVGLARRKMLVIVTPERSQGKSFMVRQMVHNDKVLLINCRNTFSTDQFLNERDAMLLFLDDMEWKGKQGEQLKGLTSAEACTIRDAWINHCFKGGIPVVMATNDTDNINTWGNNQAYNQDMVVVHFKEYLGPDGTQRKDRDYFATLDLDDYDQAIGKSELKERKALIAELGGIDMLKQLKVNYSDIDELRKCAQTKNLKKQNDRFNEWKKKHFGVDENGNRKFIFKSNTELIEWLKENNKKTTENLQNMKQKLVCTEDKIYYPRLSKKIIKHVDTTNFTTEDNVASALNKNGAKVNIEPTINSGINNFNKSRSNIVANNNNGNTNYRYGYNSKPEINIHVQTAPNINNDMTVLIHDGLNLSKDAGGQRYYYSQGTRLQQLNNTDILYKGNPDSTINSLTGTNMNSSYSYIQQNQGGSKDLGVNNDSQTSKRMYDQTMFENSMDENPNKALKNNKNKSIRVDHSNKENIQYYSNNVPNRIKCEDGQIIYTQPKTYNDAASVQSYISQRSNTNTGGLIDRDLFL
jgi:hypothetical protein